MATAALVARGCYTRQVGARELLVAAEQRRCDLSNLRHQEGIGAYLTFLTAQQRTVTPRRIPLSARAPTAWPI